MIFGFSLGAILARLIAQEYPVRHIILASVTPDHNFTNPETRKLFFELSGREFVQDIIDHLTPEHKAAQQTVMYGDEEGEPADIVVPHTGHELTDAYIEEISKLL